MKERHRINVVNLFPEDALGWSCVKRRQLVYGCHGGVFERFHLSVLLKAKLPAASGQYLAYLDRAKLRSRLTQDNFSGKAGAPLPHP